MADMTDYETLAGRLAYGQRGGGERALSIATPGIQARAGLRDKMHLLNLARMRERARQRRGLEDTQFDQWKESQKPGMLDWLGLGGGTAGVLYNIFKKD